MTNITFGYTIFYVDDVAATVAFFRDAFGLDQRLLTPELDYGELDTGATTLAFASNELAESNLAAAGGFARLVPDAPQGVAITLLTDDVPATLASAIDAGARPYGDPVDKPWGQTVAYVLDPNGVIIEVATPVV